MSAQTNAQAPVDVALCIQMDVRSARNANRVANQIRRQWPERPDAVKAARDMRDAAIRSARSRRAALARVGGVL